MIVLYVDMKQKVARVFQGIFQDILKFFRKFNGFLYLEIAPIFHTSIVLFPGGGLKRKRNAHCTCTVVLKLLCKSVSFSWIHYLCMNFYETMKGLY